MHGSIKLSPSLVKRKEGRKEGKDVTGEWQIFLYSENLKRVEKNRESPYTLDEGHKSKR